MWHRQSLELELYIQRVMGYHCLQPSNRIGHTSEALARRHVRRDTRELDVDTDGQGVCEVSIRVWSTLVFHSKMWRLLGRLRYTDVYPLLFPLCDDLCCLADILRNMQRACNVIGRAQWQYSQGKAAFGNVGNHASHQSIATGSDSHIHATFFPDYSLCRQII